MVQHATARPRRRPSTGDTFANVYTKYTHTHKQNVFFVVESLCSVILVETGVAVTEHTPADVQNGSIAPGHGTKNLENKPWHDLLMLVVLVYVYEKSTRS